MDEVAPRQNHGRRASFHLEIQGRRYCAGRRTLPEGSRDERVVMRRTMKTAGGCGPTSQATTCKRRGLPGSMRVGALKRNSPSSRVTGSGEPPTLAEYESRFARKG